MPRTPSSSASLAACVCYNVRSAARAVTDLYDRMLEPCGLRLSQMALLAAIADSPGATQHEIAAKLGLDPSTMTRTLRPLEQRGLVRTRAGNDRRAKRLTLSPGGRTALSECVRLWRKAQRTLREQLGDERFVRILADLEALRDVAREKPNDA